MNARIHPLASQSDARLGIRFPIGTVLLVALMFMISTSLAGAETNSTGTNPQNQFTRECRLLGGKPKRESTHIVSCNWDTGSKTTCDFNQTPAVCTFTPAPKPAASTNGNGAVVITDATSSNATITQANSGIVATN